MSMKKSNDTIGNRTHDLPACSAVPQPTVLPHAPLKEKVWYINLSICIYMTPDEGRLLKYAGSSIGK